MEKIQERALKFITNDYSFNYEKLPNESNTSTMAIKRVHSLCTEIFKSLDNLNAPYMKDLFHRNVSAHSLRSSNDLLVPRVNQTTFGLRSIKYEGAVMWNHLLKHIKTAENIATFKKLIRSWKGPQCKCAYCKYANESTDHCWTKYLHFWYFMFDSYAWWLMAMPRLEAVWPLASSSMGAWEVYDLGECYSLEVVSILVMYCLWAWGLGGFASIFISFNHTVKPGFHIVVSGLSRSLLNLKFRQKP